MMTDEDILALKAALEKRRKEFHIWVDLKTSSTQGADAEAAIAAAEIVPGK